MLPGEIGFQVIGENGKPLEHTDSSSPVDSVTEATRPLWWQSAWGSVVEAGKPTVEDAPPPATRIKPPHPTPSGAAPVTGPVDDAVIAAQLGRPPRGVHDVAHRCPCGSPDVVATEPRLEDGTPFPTTFYLTCPRAASPDRHPGGLRADAGDVRAARGRRGPRRRRTGRAHEAYLAARESIGQVPEIAGVSAGWHARPGSSACTSWPPSRWPRARA